MTLQTTPPVELSPRRRSAALLLLAGAGAVSSVNISVVNVALADLAHDLDATTADLQWILNSYTLVYVGLMLAAATWGDRIGRVKAFRIGLVGAAVTSAMAAFAPSPTALIALRAMMGGAMALIVPVSLSIVATIYTDPRERARAFGIWVGVGSLGLAVGPLAGGALLEHFWWGSVIVVNVPILLAMLVASRWFLPESRALSTTRYDIGGMVLSVAGLSVVVWAIIEAPIRGWTSPIIIGGFVLGAGLLVAFVLCELRVDAPMLDLSYLRDARINVALGAFTASMFSFTGLLLIVSLLLRSVFEYGPLHTGTAFVPLALAMMVGSTVSARVTERLGADRAVALGLGLVAAGWIVFATLGVDSDYLKVAASSVMVAFGFGLVNAPLVDALINALPGDKAGLASALGTVMRNVGQVLGVAVLGSLQSSAYRSQLSSSTAELGLSPDALAASQESIARGLEVATDVGGRTGAALADAAMTAFIYGMRVAAVGAVAVAGAALVCSLRYLPSRADARQVVAGLAMTDDEVGA